MFWSRWYGLSKTPTVFQIGDTFKKSIFWGGPFCAILAFFGVFGTLSCLNQRRYGGASHLCFGPVGMGYPKHQLSSKSETLLKNRFFGVGHFVQFWPFWGSL